MAFDAYLLTAVLDEIRQTVTAPTKPFLLPRSASPKAPRQRTVKASGS